MPLEIQNLVAQQTATAPITPVGDHIANAIIVGFVAEHSLSFTVVPVIINRTKRHGIHLHLL